MDVCPPRHMLVAFADGSIDEESFRRCELHLNSCTQCQQTLTQLFPTPDSHLLAWRSTSSGASWTESNESVVAEAAAHRLWSQQLRSGQPAIPASSVDVKRIHIEPGLTIGRYRVERVLGSGGFGAVVAAFDEKLMRHVAIKLPHACFIETAEQLEFALAEAQTVAGLDHPNIVPIYDVGSTDSHPLFLVSKLISGQSLAEYARKHTISYNLAARFIADVADALEYAHSRGIVHRDVKPQNILIDADGKALLTDFGLAWISPSANDCHASSRDSRVAPSGGTPAYMAPEQLACDAANITARTDIYALGRVLGELLDVAEAGRSAALISSHDTTGLAHELRSICQTAVASRSEDRFASMAALASELRQSLQRADGKRAARPKPIILGTLLIAVLGLVWISYAGYRASQARQRQTRVNEVIEGMLSATPSQFLTNLADVKALDEQSFDALRVAASEQDADRSPRAHLALLQLQDAAHRDEHIKAVSEAMLAADSHWLCTWIIAVKEHAELFREPMRQTLALPTNASSSRLLNAAQFMATFPEDLIWEDVPVCTSVAQALLLEDEANAHFRAKHMLSVGKRLSQAYSRLLTDSTRRTSADQPRHIFQLWAILAGNDVEEVVELLSTGPNFLQEALFKQLQDDEPTHARLLEILDGQMSLRNSIKQSARKRVAALALLSLGHEEEFWSRWTHSRDPSFVTNLMYSVGPAPLTHSAILKRMVATNALKVVNELPSDLKTCLYSPQLSQRRAMLQALGQPRSERQLSDVELQQLVERLRELAIDDADPAVHGLAADLLSTVGKEFPPQVEPSRAREVTMASKKRWHVNSLGQTMVHIPLPRGGFAIACCETEREHFEKFLTETEYAWDGERMTNTTPQSSHLRSCPQLELSWYDCAAYCNWLSRKEGLEECFETNKAGQFATGMHIKANAPALNGYRLPLASEWTIACEAGVSTPYYFGNGVFTPSDYMWMLPHSANQGQPVGKLRPNALGLYDMLGNAAEWTLDDTQAGCRLREVTDAVPRVYRGGSISDTRLTQLNGLVRAFSPADRRNKYTGLRLVRTLK